MHIQFKFELNILPVYIEAQEIQTNKPAADLIYSENIFLKSSIGSRSKSDNFFLEANGKF